ncbi:MAG: hypothetical protein LBL95_06685 [Deltaproteobacteria bacterium]|nr:hypothetical protein [Deltaproteobacteria bacterium]
MPEFPNSSSLKTFVRRDQGPKRFHIMILSADGQTRRLSFSPSFFWILGILMAITFGSLAFLAHQFANLTLERDSLESSLRNVVRFHEIRDYSQSVTMAPEEARRILEILDRAIVMSETDDGEAGLIGVPEASPPEAGPAGPGDQAAAAGEEAGETVPGPEEAPAGSQGQQDAPAEASSPLREAWRAWHEASGVPRELASLDIDDFEVSGGGQITFLLRQSGEPGQREKGRALTVLAVSDEAGRVSLVSAPQIDLSSPEQGWELGAKYNIMASKLMRAKADLPAGARILNAEVVAWEEDSKELVFRKKILIEDR